MFKKTSRQVLFLLLCFVSCSFIFPYPSIAYAAIRILPEQYTDGVYEARFPQIAAETAVGDRINQEIQAYIKDFIATQKEYNPKTVKTDYKLHHLSDRYLSFEIISYVYSGGAHGMTTIKGFTYDLSTGAPCSFTKLFDFRPSEINTAVWEYCKKNQIPLYDHFTGIETYPTQFYLETDTKAVIIFQQYEIAPYSSGIIRIPLHK